MTPPRTPYAASVRPRARADGSVAHDLRYRLDGRSLSVSFDSDKHAQKWARIFRTIGPAESLKLLGRDLSDTSPTVNEYAERYINTKSGVEGKTLDHYRMFMRLHIGPTLGELPIDAVSKDMIAAWVNFQAEDGDAAKSIKNRHGFLSGMFQSAIDEEPSLITRNPCAKTNLPASESQEMVFLSPNEFTTLLGYIPAFYQPLVLTLAATALRWGEATALKPSDFDLDARTVRVSRAWKSSMARGWYLGPPKTRKSKRTVSLPDDLIPILRPLVESGSEFVFTSYRGKPLRQANFWSQVWEPARRMANGKPAFDLSQRNKELAWQPRIDGVWDREPAKVPLGKTPRIHDLRHSHASWLIAAGVPLPVIQARLGHESITTTISTYGHLSPDMMQGVAGTVGRILAGSMPQLLP